MRDKNIVKVYCKNRYVGTIEKTKDGSAFIYNQKYKVKDIALHLPLFKSKFETHGVNLHSFFAGLLPEGLRLQRLIKTTKTSKDDLLTLLIASGKETIGDIHIANDKKNISSAYPEVDIKKLHKISFNETFNKITSYTKRTPHSSIPGVQNKISAGMISFPLKIKKNKNAFFILKLKSSEAPRIIANEFFFMNLARSCDIKVPDVSIVKDKDGEEGLLVARFDRVLGDNEVLKLHTEDACQFLDLYPAEKYNVSFREVAEGVAKFSSTPIIDVLDLLRIKAFSYLIGNGDLHAKNVSLVENLRTGRMELAPAYDLLSTYPYGDKKMALKFDGKDDNLKRKYFIAFAARFELNAKATNAMLDRLIKKLEPSIVKIPEIGLDEKQTKSLQKLMRKRIEDLKT